MRERDIEQHLVRRAHEAGDEIRKVRWIGRRGAPDRLLMRRSLWIELKAPGVAPEAHQVREHDRMRQMGHRVLVIDSIEAVDALFT